MTPWLVLDTTYLCHRAFHSTGHLSYGGLRAGVTYGLLQTVASLQQLFGSDRIAFCFDSGRSKRYDLCPTYKQKRQPLTEDQQQLKAELGKQINLLRDEYLPTLGFRNIFYKNGYEADDFVAQVVDTLCYDRKHPEEVIMVGSDKDLYQCISPFSSLYNPQKQRMLAFASFIEEFGIEPYYWDRVKAWAGCNSDCIPGIPGVGEKTAIKYLRRNLKDGTLYTKFKNHYDLYRANLRLVRLPFEGTPEVTFQEDEVSEKGWHKVMSKLGIRNIRPFLGARQ